MENTITPNVMAGLTFRLKGRELLKIGTGSKTMYSLSKDSVVSYQTIHRWITTPHNVKMLDLDTLANFLLDGLGVPPDSLDSVTLADIFEVVKKDESEAT